MGTTVNLYSSKTGEIKRFLSSFYSSNEKFSVTNDLKWEKTYDNPVEISDMIGALIDNDDKFDINMWVCLDQDIFINVTPANSDTIIRYLYERYPY